MFHFSNLGNFGTEVKTFADRNGYVPETGDKPEDFNFGSDDFIADFEDGDGWDGYAASRWEEFVASARAATTAARLALEAWRKINH